MESEYYKQGMESIVQERVEKERKESKIRHCRGENGRRKRGVATRGEEC